MLNKQFLKSLVALEEIGPDRLALFELNPPK
jgi:hypothetical protein